MAPFSKPETVLKQAEGLVSVGQAHAALQSLTEMFSSKRFRSTPLTSLEPIMNRFIELCVDMRKGRTAKEGLMQYKNIAQNTSVQSIETVIMRFVQLADAKVREAQEKAAVQVAVDVDDLEASETPESILLGAVSGDQSKDRTDRALVTPWLKFLWESYRTSLETLKNNARLESIYQQIAQQAFKFCLKHQRKVEFRRLCETLRLHLANVAKYSHQPHSINLSDPDTLQHHLDTRFAQLNTSVELELWQEAFRSVEDVHNLLTMAKKAPRPAMMANYYEKLTKIFLMSGNALYHAAAWGRYYAIVTSIGGKSEEELSKLAGQVLVSALAVPVGLHSDEPEEVKGKAGRLTSLLGLTRTPTRAGLLKDALSRDVLKLSPAPVKSLYQLLEVTFNPLTLCSSIAPLLNTLESSYLPYLPLLHQALLSRLFSHLSQVYSSIKITNLLELVKPLRDAGVEGAYEDEQIEAYIMGCARRGELNIRVDHLDGSIIFLDEPFATTSSTDDSARASTSTAGAGYNKDPSAIQPNLSELVRTRLGDVALCLHNSIQVLDAPQAAAQKEEEEEEAQKEKLTSLVAAVTAERKALLLRRAIVARRRELSGELTARREKEEVSRRAEQTRKEKEEEERKARMEMQNRERERNRRELEQIRQQETDKLAKGMIQTGMLKAEDLERLQKEQTFDTGDLISLQVQHIEKEKREINHRLRVISKRIDHLERAYRKEERPLVAQDYEHQRATDRETFNAVQKLRKENALQAHKEDLETKKRLARVTGDWEKRKEVLIARKGEEFARRRDVAVRKIEEEKARRRKAVQAEREEERRREQEEERIRREQEEEERRLEEERIAEEERIRAEEEAAAAAAEATKREAEEKAAAVRKQRDAERAAAAEQARLQQQREEEAEARRQARAREREQAPARPSPFGRATAGEGQTAWRRSTPTSSVPSTPSRATNNASSTPPRAESPSPAAPAAAAGKYRPGALGGGGGGWRAREEAKKAGGGPAPPADAPANGAGPQKAKDEDGFQT
ncbi:eukaryotic translation initiation factor 3 subunit A, partial [Marasmius crinis-equi]